MIHFRYGFNAQQETVIQYALLWSNDALQRAGIQETVQINRFNTQSNEFNVQGNPQSGGCPEGTYFNGFFCESVCGQGLEYINGACVPIFNQDQFGN